MLLSSPVAASQPERHTAVPGGTKRSGGCYSSTVIPIALEWHAQLSHWGGALRWPHTSGHVVDVDEDDDEIWQCFWNNHLVFLLENQSSDSPVCDPSIQAGVGKVHDDVAAKERPVHHSWCEVTAVFSKFIHGPAKQKMVVLLFLAVSWSVSIRDIIASPQKANNYYK